MGTIDRDGGAARSSHIHVTGLAIIAHRVSCGVRISSENFCRPRHRIIKSYGLRNVDAVVSGRGRIFKGINIRCCVEVMAAHTRGRGRVIGGTAGSFPIGIANGTQARIIVTACTVRAGKGGVILGCLTGRGCDIGMASITAARDAGIRIKPLVKGRIFPSLSAVRSHADGAVADIAIEGRHFRQGV